MRLATFQVLPALVMLVTPITFAASASADGNHAADADMAVREEIHRSYELAPGATVEVSGIAGPVEIETAAGTAAGVNIVRSAPTKADLACGKIVIDPIPSGLRIKSESLCSVVRGRQRVALRLPRSADVTLKNVAGDVRIGPTDGFVRLESIAGHVRASELRAARMSSLAGGLEITVADLAERGIHVSSVTGSIDLGLPAGLNADLDVRSLVGRVRADVPELRTTGDDDDSDYHAVIGAGGSKILFESVVGPIDIHEQR